jgi:transposase
MKGRVFTAEFKLTIVRQVLAGEKTVIQLCREHNLSDSLIHNWKKLYREKGEAAFATSTARTATSETPETQELRELRNRIAELERFIGQQSVELSILKKVSELLSQPSSNGVKLTNASSP